MTVDDVTGVEVQIARMSREFHGEVLAVGSTPQGDIAARVAKLVHDDRLVLLGASSYSAFDCDAGVALLHDEYITRTTARGRVDWSLVFEMVAADKMQIFIGPPQIDRAGNANISVIGDWTSPTIQLIGSRGLPDDLWRLSRINYHVPRQTAKSVVSQVDFVSAFGNVPARKELGCTTGRPGVLVTDLGVFHWPDDGPMEIESIHPGVTVEQVQRATGFPIQIPSDIATTEGPSTDELAAIRHIDPFGIRDGDRSGARPLGRALAHALTSPDRRRLV